MCFVGRKKEISLIIKALEKGTNIVLSGKYGIGRTALIKNIVNTQDRWLFFWLDFSKTPGEVCNALYKRLFPDHKYKNRYKYEKYKTSRFQIVNFNLPDNRRHILILDNIARLSPHKIKFLRYLTTERRFGFIAIIEDFLTEPDLLRLRLVLSPEIQIKLSHFGNHTTQEYLRKSSKKYSFNWSENRIKTLSEIIEGYPLAMKEMVLMEFKRC
jgi:hypothetical protein